MSLVVLEVFNLGAALKMVSESGLSAGFEILEILPHTEGVTLLATGKVEALETALKNHSVRGHVSASLNSGGEALLRAMAALDAAPLEQGLLVLESADTGALFKAARQAIELGLKIAEFRPRRGVMPLGSLCLTGAAPGFDLLEVWIPTERLPVEWTRITTTAALAKYFDLSPRSEKA